MAGYLLLRLLFSYLPVGCRTKYESCTGNTGIKTEENIIFIYIFKIYKKQFIISSILSKFLELMICIITDKIQSYIFSLKAIFKKKGKSLNMKTGNIVYDLLYYIYYKYLIYTSKNHHILHFRFIFPKNCKLIRTLFVGDEVRERLSTL